MLELRATTPAGIQARAHSLALMNGHGDWSWDPEGIHGQMLAALLRDAAAIGGTQVALPPSPDAELLALCADYMATWQAVQNHPVASLVGEIPKDLEDSYGELLDKLGSLTEEIAALHAVTSEGRRAKAAVARANLGYRESFGPKLTAFDGDGCRTAIAWSLIHDELGEAAPWGKATA